MGFLGHNLYLFCQIAKSGIPPMIPIFRQASDDLWEPGNKRIPVMQVFWYLTLELLSSLFSQDMEAGLWDNRMQKWYISLMRLDMKGSITSAMTFPFLVWRKPFATHEGKSRSSYGSCWPCDHCHMSHWHWRRFTRSHLDLGITLHTRMLMLSHKRT